MRSSAAVETACFTKGKCGVTFCSNHPKQIAVGECSRCGIGICAQCQAVAEGHVICKSCAVQVHLTSPRKISSHRNPFIAAVFSLALPGSGQIYNGQLGKGIGVFLVCWLIIPWVMGMDSYWIFVPWVYGVIDAFGNACRIEARQSFAALNPLGIVIQCLILLLMLFWGPFMMSNIYQSMVKSHLESHVDIKIILQEISEAAEHYAGDHGEYPQSQSELYFSSPPYLRDLYCDTEQQGYRISCVFSRQGYALDAAAIEDPAMAASYKITTGGVLTETPAAVSSNPKRWVF